MSTALVVGIIALLGVLVTQGIVLVVAWRSRVADRRVELLRNVRWAAELAVKDDDASVAVGVGVLAALDGAEAFRDEDQAMISAILDVVVDDVAEDYRPGDEFTLEEATRLLEIADGFRERQRYHSSQEVHHDDEEQ